MIEVNLNKYIQWVKEGRSFAEIRKDLLIRGFSDNDVTTILSYLNDHLLQEEISKEKNRNARNWKWAGWFLIAISLFLSVYSFRSASVILIAGGLLGGGAMIMNSSRLQRGPSMFTRKIQQGRRR